ncbi:MAG: hypothetical protein EOO00_09845, partial [Chitinophagaceae bacterium]
HYTSRQYYRGIIILNENKAIIQRWFEEIWNQGSEEAIDELLAPEAILHGLEHPDSVGKTGPESFKPFFRAFRGAFPDMVISLNEIVAEDDRVMVHFTATGSYKGNELGLVASEKPIHVNGMCFARIQNGQLVEGHNTIELLNMTGNFS